MARSRGGHATFVSFFESFSVSLNCFAAVLVVSVFFHWHDDAPLRCLEATSRRKTTASVARQFGLDKMLFYWKERVWGKAITSVTQSRRFLWGQKKSHYILPRRCKQATCWAGFRPGVFDLASLRETESCFLFLLSMGGQRSDSAAEKQPGAVKALCPTSRRAEREGRLLQREL